MSRSLFCLFRIVFLRILVLLICSVTGYLLFEMSNFIQIFSLHWTSNFCEHYEPQKLQHGKLEYWKVNAPLHALSFNDTFEKIFFSPPKSWYTAFFDYVDTLHVSLTERKLPLGMKEAVGWAYEYRNLHISQIQELGIHLAIAVVKCNIPSLTGTLKSVGYWVRPRRFIINGSYPSY